MYEKQLINHTKDEVIKLNKVKKALTYTVGATVIAAASAYLAMPKEARKNLKDMVMNLTKSKKSTEKSE